jgi:hypothetical protein
MGGDKPGKDTREHNISQARIQALSVTQHENLSSDIGPSQ